MRKSYLSSSSIYKILVLLLLILVLTSCSSNNGNITPEPPFKLSNLGKSLPKVYISDGEKSIGWLQGDATFQTKTNKGTEFTYHGANRKEALKLPGVRIKDYSIVTITADSIDGLHTPKISAMLYNAQGKIVNYTLFDKKYGLSMDFSIAGKYLWMVYVDWGKGNNNSIYWFKLNVFKDKNNLGPPIYNGYIPNSVTWKGEKYQVLGFTTKDIGQKLGTAYRYVVYSIKGFDSSKEIAVKYGKWYMKAVIFSTQDREWMAKQRVLDEMYTYVITKKFNVPDCDFNYQMKMVVDDTNRLTYSDKSQYESIIKLLKTKKYKEATDLIDKLQGGVSEVIY